MGIPYLNGFRMACITASASGVNFHGLWSSQRLRNGNWTTRIVMKRKISTYSKIPVSINIKIEPFDVNKRYTKPHRHNKYLELVYFSKGTGFHYMDHKNRDAIEPPVAFIIKKDQVHHWEIDTVPEKGDVIIIKESFLDVTLDRHINLQLQRLGDLQMIRLETDTSIDGLFKIASEEMGKSPKGRKIVVEGVLKALLSKISGYADIKANLIRALYHRGSASCWNHRLKNDVSHYAQLLHITPQNLNAHCKKEYAKTASEYIAGHILEEAKRLLCYTDLSVTEIAFTFDFKDVSHFVKYFKRHQGKTPLQFKKTAVIP